MRVRGRSGFCLAFLLLSVFLIQKEALPAQLDKFPGSLLAKPDFFPIGVWLQDPKNASAYKEIGINLFIGLWKGPTKTQLDHLKAAGMPVFSAQNEIGLTDPNRDIIVGWLLKDEPDNAQPQPSGSGFGPPISPAEMIKRYRSIKERDPSRPVLLNLGQGVAWDQWYGRGTRTNHPEDYKEYVMGADIVSFDIYPVTHRDATVRGRLDFVARGVDRLVKWTSNSKPVWSVIQASRVDNPDVLPTGDEIRNMVWLSIIHGARGIVYFVHQFSPKFVEAALLQNDELSDAVASINARITALAGVLNSESIMDAVTAQPVDRTHAGSISMLVKRDRCHLYVFAGSKSKFSDEVHFSVAGEFSHQEIEVLDENRSIGLKEGVFQDSFGAYATHLYKIPVSGENCA